jgi:hypothetical protein
VRPKEEIVDEIISHIRDESGYADVYLVELLADIRDQLARLNGVLEDVANLTAEQVELAANRAEEEAS